MFNSRLLTTLLATVWVASLAISPAYSDMVPLPYDQTACDEAYAVNLVSVTEADPGFLLLASDLPAEPPEPGMAPVPLASPTTAVANSSMNATMFWLYD